MESAASSDNAEAVTALVRRLVESGQPFTIALGEPDRYTGGHKSFTADEVDGMAATGECKRWAYVPGQGLVCIER